MRARRGTALLVVVAALVLASVPALARVPAHSAPKAVVASKATIVARVVALSGRQLYLKRGGRLVALKRGGSIALHALIVLGPRTKATLSLAVPAGIDPTADIMDVASFSRLPVPNASRIGKQFGVIAGSVGSDHTLHLEPQLIELAP
jgi:hypothetical protein